MAVGDATKWFTKQAGDPSTGFVSGGDAVSSVTQIYTDMSANGSVTDAMLAVPKVDQSVVGNLFTANQAYVADGNTTGFGVGGTTLSVVSGGTFGPNALQVSRSGAGTSYVVIGGGNYFSPPFTVAVTPGLPYTAEVDVWSLDSTESSKLQVRYFNAANAQVQTFSTATISLSTTPKRLRVTSVAPAGSAWAALFVDKTQSSSGTETWRIDRAGFWRGAGGDWAPPGTPITNLGTYTDESVGRRIFTWDTVNNRWQMTYGDTGLRNVAADLTNGWAVQAGGAILRRVGNVVSFAGYFNGTSATSGTMYAIPAGFQSYEFDTSIRVFAGPSSTTPLGIVRIEAGADEIQLFGSYVGTNRLVSLRWQTFDAWPTSLPGSAVGSIPS